MGVSKAHKKPACSAHPGTMKRPAKKPAAKASTLGKKPSSLEDAVAPMVTETKEDDEKTLILGEIIPGSPASDLPPGSPHDSGDDEENHSSRWEMWTLMPLQALPHQCMSLKLS